jgi:hypothetical protein
MRDLAHPVRTTTVAIFVVVTALRKRQLLVAVGLSVAALAAVGTATASPVPKYDRVTGSGQRAGFGSPEAYTPSFTIDARSGPSGADTRGTMTIDWGTSWVDAPFFGAAYSTTVNVTNLCVTGDTATIVGIITSGTPNAAIGDPLVTVVHDGGKGGKSDGMLGVFSGGDFFGARTLDEVCHNPYPPEPLGAALLPLVSGNINVTDAA